MPQRCMVSPLVESVADLSNYQASSGRLVPVWTVEVQTLLEDVDRILDAIMPVCALQYGRYRRNASISAQGMETAQPEPGSVSVTHMPDVAPGDTETYPMVELKISVDRDCDLLAQVMDAIHGAHHYEEPVIFVREAWASRANYDPDRSNPNRFWNNGRGLPARIKRIGS